MKLSKKDIEAAERAIPDIKKIKENEEIIKMSCENYFGYFNPSSTINYAMIRLDQIPDSINVK